MMCMSDEVRHAHHSTHPDAPQGHGEVPPGRGCGGVPRNFPPLTTAGQGETECPVRAGVGGGPPNSSQLTLTARELLMADILLIHGAGDSAAIWERQVEALGGK